MKFEGWTRALIMFLAGVGTATVVRGCVSVAKAGQDGLFAEIHGDADGVTVRRWRDTSNGTVCYVASGLQLGDYRNWREGRSVAISCLRVSQ